MKLRTRFFFVLVLTIAGVFAFFWFVNSPSMVAQDLSITNTAFVSPLAPFRSPIAAPIDRRVVSDNTKWLFAYDVVDNPYETMRSPRRWVRPTLEPYQRFYDRTSSCRYHFAREQWSSDALY